VAQLLPVLWIGQTLQLLLPETLADTLQSLLGEDVDGHRCHPWQADGSVPEQLPGRRAHGKPAPPRVHEHAVSAIVRARKPA